MLIWESWIKWGGLGLEVGNDGLTHFLDALQPNRDAQEVKVSVSRKEAGAESLGLFLQSLRVEWSLQGRQFTVHQCVETHSAWVKPQLCPVPECPRDIQPIATRHW